MELVGNLCQATTTICLTSGTFATDDLWIRFGAWNAWDVKVGRFEAWEVYHTGHGNGAVHARASGRGHVRRRHVHDPEARGADLLWRDLSPRPAQRRAGAWDMRPTSISDGLPAIRAARQAWLATTTAPTTRPAIRRGTISAAARRSSSTSVGSSSGSAGEYQKRTATTQRIDPGMPAHKKDPVPTARAEGRGRIDPVRDQSDRRIRCERGDRQPGRHERLRQARCRKTPSTTTSVGGFANVRFTERLVAGAGVNWTSQTDAVLAAGSTANDFTSQLQGFWRASVSAVGPPLRQGRARPMRAPNFLPSDLAVPSGTTTCTAAVSDCFTFIDQSTRSPSIANGTTGTPGRSPRTRSRRRASADSRTCGCSIPRRRPAPHQRRGHLALADFCPAIYPLLSGATTCTAAGSA